MRRSSWGAVAVLCAATGLVGCDEERVVVEPMEVPLLSAVTARGCGEAIGPARVWDFTGGKAPAGGHVEKGGRLTSAGLVCTDVTNELVRAGYWLEGASTPDGAFLLEADVVLGNAAREILHRQRDGILWDDMGVNYKPVRDNRGLQIVFGQGPAGSWSPVIHLGLGDETYQVSAPVCKRFKPGEVAHFAFFYGANGRVVIEFGGDVVDTEIPVRRPLAGSGRNAVIGSRQISCYYHFDGTVKRLSITPMRIDPFAIATKGPTAFLRGETNANLRLSVANCLGSRLTGAAVRAEQFCASGRVRVTDLPLGNFAVCESTEIALPLETRLKPGWQVIRMTVSGKGPDGESVTFSKLIRYGIGPVRADGLVAQMWGFADDLENLAQIGFSHGSSFSAPDLSGANPQFEAMLDEALVRGVRITRRVDVLYPPGKDKAKFLRKTRDGKTGYDQYFDVPEVSNPELQKLIRRITAADAERLSEYAAFSGVLPCSEHRDGSFPSFNTEHLRYKAETGCAVPGTVVAKSHTWRDLDAMKKRYPTGVVPEDDPELLYYRWFWSGGDGWPAYVSAASEEYRQRIQRPDFFTFWDPAVRAPARWGSGGSVDMLNQWCYALPEPMNVAGPCEELFAMVAGRPGQKVGIMTQLICYRSWLAPKDIKVEPVPDWVKRLPDAEFPTIPPDHLQEAVWSMIAKPVQAIMFHGWGTIQDTGEKRSYCFTNPETRQRLTEMLTNGPVATLGPTLKRLGRKEQPVAVFESFTSAVMGGPASWGWKAPAITFFQRARLDPRVIFEEQILRDGFEGIKVLYAPQCVFLTPQFISIIKDFQRKGGILVADQDCVSALKPDIVVPTISFDAPPDSDHSDEVNAQEAMKSGDAKSKQATVRAKSFMLENAEAVRAALAKRGYSPEMDSSTPEIVTYARQWKDVPYVIAVNDRRTFGDYVGAWGRTMEKGLPCEGELSVRDPNGRLAAAYELALGGELPLMRRDGKAVVPVKYSTNDGRMVVFLPERIAAVSVDAPSCVKTGDRIRVRFAVKGASGRPIPALLPVDVRLADAAGNEIDGSGAACAVDGICDVEFRTNLDDDRRGYRLVCRDLASGLKSERIIKRK